MTNDVKKVPELRFPEFDGEWEEDKLRDLLKDNVILEQSDGNHGELYPKSSEFTEDGIPYLAASNISNNSISYQNIKYLPLERAKQFKKGVARDGDILLAHNATVGPSTLLITDFPFVILSTTLTLYRINKVKMDNHFFLNEIRSNNVQNQLKKLMKQTTRNQVPILLQRTMHISYPKILAEQHKIGSFFSKLDRQIELEEQKLVKLEEQKKGYMQNLFSQELRFKDENGNDYPEWETKKLDELGEFNSGVGFPEKYQGGSIGVPFF
ncbi:MAG: restriction endonuclease subunit S, partial [Staphylococcus saprophyticus]